MELERLGYGDFLRINRACRNIDPWSLSPDGLRDFLVQDLERKYQALAELVARLSPRAMQALWQHVRQRRIPGPTRRG